MRVKYLLPCSCGKNALVETTQAGQTIQCECGRSLEVPTMQGLRGLEQVAPEMTSRRNGSNWGSRQAVVLLGIVITLIGMTLISYYYSIRPTQENFSSAEWFTPSESWHVWQDLRTGIKVPLFTKSPYIESISAYRRWMGMAIGIAVLGGLTMASALLIPKPRRRRPIE